MGPFIGNTGPHNSLKPVCLRSSGVNFPSAPAVTNGLAFLHLHRHWNRHFHRHYLHHHLHHHHHHRRRRRRRRCRCVVVIIIIIIIIIIITSIMCTYPGPKSGIPASVMSGQYETKTQFPGSFLSKCAWRKQTIQQLRCRRKRSMT